MTNGIRPARFSTHIRSSTARARATRRYISRRSSGVRPRSAPSVGSGGVAAPGSECVTATALSVDRSEVDRPTVDGHRRLAEDLGEGRMGVGRSADLPRNRLELESDGRLGNQVCRVRTDDVDAERLVGFLVGDDLREALVLAADDGLRDRLERDLADLDRQASLLALL